LQSMDEALRPKLETVACLYSDIRRFTQQSKDLSGFLLRSALPNIRYCTDVVESCGGIPRLIGDLIFAYFDGENPEASLLAAMRAGFSLVEINEELNRAATSGFEVHRFVVLSYGEAMVGNIGAQYGSREITALGPPVNIL